MGNRRRGDKITERDRATVRKRIAQGVSAADIAESLGINRSTVHRIARGYGGATKIRADARGQG